MSTPFDATASMLGYLYQCRLALLDALRRARKEGSFTVAIETLDDVVFDTEGDAKDLLQLKHHLNAEGNVTDASSDIWKSFRIWSEGTSKGEWPDDTRFYLVTTANAVADTVAGLLVVGEQRDAARALTKLEAVARTSESEANAKGYKAFLDLKDDVRAALVERVVVLPGVSDVFDVEVALREEVSHAVNRELRSPFVERLEGWWFQRVVQHLRRIDATPIESEELDAKLDALRQQFQDDNLPIDPDLADLDIEGIDPAGFMGEVFVRQLELINVKSRRLVNAMLQYYRASQQRSRWLREGFLLAGELTAYDRRLAEEWRVRFDAMAEEIGEEAAEAEMIDAARTLYKWAEQDAMILIRPSVDQAFVTRGSLHILADARRVGWHPEFFQRLGQAAGAGQ